MIDCFQKPPPPSFGGRRKKILLFPPPSLFELTGVEKEGGERVCSPLPTPTSGRVAFIIIVISVGNTMGLPVAVGWVGLGVATHR